MAAMSSGNSSRAVGAGSGSLMTAIRKPAGGPGAWRPYAVNVGDGPPLAHGRGRMAAVRSVFGHACVIAETTVLAGTTFGNLVMAAAARPLPVADLAARAARDPSPAQVVADAALDLFLAGSTPITDAHAEPSPLPPPDVFA